MQEQLLGPSASRVERSRVVFLIRSFPGFDFYGRDPRRAAPRRYDMGAYIATPCRVHIVPLDTGHYKKV